MHTQLERTFDNAQREVHKKQTVAARIKDPSFTGTAAAI